MDMVIVVDVERCLGCRSCGLACAVAHSRSGDLLGAIEEEDKPCSRLILDNVDDMVVPLQCRHCEDAPCIEVCPTGAISRANQDSPVILDNEKCIGCHACIIVCPFGVIKRGADGRSLVKCDFCAARLAEGEPPACVAACPTKAMQYLSLDDVSAKKRRDYVRKYKVALAKGAESDESGSPRR